MQVTGDAEHGRTRAFEASDEAMARGDRPGVRHAGTLPLTRTDLPDAPIVLARAGGKVLLEAEVRIIGTLSGPAPEDLHGADLTDFRMVVWHRVCTPASGD